MERIVCLALCPTCEDRPLPLPEMHLVLDLLPLQGVDASCTNTSNNSVLYTNCPYITPCLPGSLPA